MRYFLSGPGILFHPTFHTKNPKREFHVIPSNHQEATRNRVMQRGNGLDEEMKREFSVETVLAPEGVLHPN